MSIVSYKYHKGELYFHNIGDRPKGSAVFRNILRVVSQLNKETFAKDGPANPLNITLTSQGPHFKISIDGMGEILINKATFENLTKEERPLPLRNEGNTCFINATFQMLMHSPDLCKTLKETYEKKLAKNETNSREKIVYQTFLDAERAYREGKNLPLNNLRYALAPTSYFESLFYQLPTTQEDASEFLIKLLEPAMENLGLRQGFEKEYEPIGKSYGEAVLLRQESKEPNFILTHTKHLELGDTGQSLLDKTLSLSPLAEKSDPATFIGKKFNPTKEKMTLEPSTPNRFIFRLKRFQYKIVNGSFTSNKIDISVPMPETLQMNGQNYTLKSIVVHSGTVHGGHYYAYVKKGPTWFKANDDDITENPANLQHGLDFGYLYYYEKA